MAMSRSWMDVKKGLALLATLSGCGGRAAYVAEEPHQERVRSSEHSAALARALISADNEGQASVVTAACDLGWAVGSLDGLGIGSDLADGTVQNHCLGAISAEMLASFAAEIGGDRATAMAKAVERAKSLCEKPRSPRPASRYGTELLRVTRNCEGNRTCAMELQSAYMGCYAAGVKESVGAETERALARMLGTCTTFRAEQPSCRNSALLMMDELHVTAGQLRTLRPDQ
jgi:hypothetical protein